MTDRKPGKDYLKASGREFYDAMKADELDPPTQVLVLQVARELDILDRLNGSLNRKTEWFRLIEEEGYDGYGKEVTLKVIVDGALGEFRQHVLAVNQVLHKLGVGAIDLKKNKPKSSRALAIAEERERMRREHVEGAGVREAEDLHESG